MTDIPTRLLTVVAATAALTLSMAASATADAPDPVPSAADLPERPAQQAPVLLPPFNFNANILGFDFKHTNQFPAGVTFDGAVWAVNPDWQILTIGWLADLAPFDTSCAAGSLVLQTKSGQIEQHPLSQACSNGYLYGLLSDHPAKDYSMVCMSSATVGDRGERACFRFMN
ncbi:hypothetical protein GPX89_08050 [Nocardia sp. ET3-3]|uniref:Uncharacterized protein n=1 Tax=Nocardia terrae TaxID=2675851 RepID=A0A7K1UTL5_9NOCA|nr:hypothetical protein [Nocardia terrae]MVU77198.1 hypothetical protein [Nocardia terrae]